MTTRQLFYHAFSHISKKLKSVLVHSAYSLFWTLERAATNWWLAASKFADGGSTWLQETSRPFQAAILKGNGKTLLLWVGDQQICSGFPGFWWIQSPKTDISWPRWWHHHAACHCFPAWSLPYEPGAELYDSLCVFTCQTYVRQALEVMTFLDCQISSCKERGKTQNIYPGRKCRRPPFTAMFEGTISHWLCDVYKYTWIPWQRQKLHIFHSEQKLAPAHAAAEIHVNLSTGLRTCTMSSAHVIISPLLVHFQSKCASPPQSRLKVGKPWADHLRPLRALMKRKMPGSFKFFPLNLLSYYKAWDLQAMTSITRGWKSWKTGRRRRAECFLT